MADLLVVHDKDTGEQIVINCDHILFGRPVPGGGTVLKLSNGEQWTIREALHVLRPRSRNP
jgi:hypothetical protein